MIHKAQRIEVRDEGSVQGRVRAVDFTGSGVTATVSGDVATVAVSAGGSSGGSGTATLAFGATPAETASVVVTGQTGILSGSQARAWWMASDTTASNDADEHEEGSMYCPLVCGSIVPGTGFTITAHPIAMYGMGDFSVRWRWE